MDDDYGEEVLNRQLDSFSSTPKTPIPIEISPIRGTTPKAIFSTKTKPPPPPIPEKKQKAISLEDLGTASVSQRQAKHLPPPSIYTIANIYHQLN